MPRHKFALLIGINYTGTKSKLKGCVNDVYNIRCCLLDKLGYENKNIVLMTDYSRSDLQPTKKNILEQLHFLIYRANQAGNAEVWIHYSGHGTSVYDISGDESDNYDEAIVPMDYLTSGYIIDDTLHKHMSKLSDNCYCVCLFDCCHSATILDLKYRYIANNQQVIENRQSRIGAQIFTISGCLDMQKSKDAFINGKNVGAMTDAFIRIINTNHHQLTCFELIGKLRNSLVALGFEQRPQICSSHKINKRTMLFSDTDRRHFIFFKIPPFIKTKKIIKT